MKAYDTTFIYAQITTTTTTDSKATSASPGSGQEQISLAITRLLRVRGQVQYRAFRVRIGENWPIWYFATINEESSIDQTHCCISCGRKPEYLVKSHTTHIGRAGKLPHHCADAMVVNSFKRVFKWYVSFVTGLFSYTQKVKQIEHSNDIVMRLRDPNSHMVTSKWPRADMAAFACTMSQAPPQQGTGSRLQMNANAEG